MSMAFSDTVKELADKRFPDGCVDFFEPSDFTIDFSSVNLSDELAKGSFGTVYRGEMDGKFYAVKLEDFNVDVGEQVNKLVELTVLQSLPHPRLVKFCGAGYLSSSTGDKVMVLMELCKTGSLREALKQNLSWNLRVSLVLDIALGLEFLHGQDIIHRDIKTNNVLVDGEWRGKLCDFSFACHEESTSKRDFIYGTTEFMSPEIALALDFDKSADIFSFGIVLCEIMTGREPSSEFMCRKAQSLFALDEEELKNAVETGCPEGLEVLACLCCDVEPDKRPVVQTCIEELESLLAELGGPPKDFISSVNSHQVAMSNGKDMDKHVLSPITVMTETFHSLSHNSDESKSKSLSDTEIKTRLAYLELQVKELRADNMRLSGELKAFMALPAQIEKEGFRVVKSGPCDTIGEEKGKQPTLQGASLLSLLGGLQAQLESVKSQIEGSDVMRKDHRLPLKSAVTSAVPSPPNLVSRFHPAAGRTAGPTPNPTVVNSHPNSLMAVSSNKPQLTGTQPTGIRPPQLNVSTSNLHPHPAISIATSHPRITTNTNNARQVAATIRHPIPIILNTIDQHLNVSTSKPHTSSTVTPHYASSVRSAPHVSVSHSAPHSASISHQNGDNLSKPIVHHDEIGTFESSTGFRSDESPISPSPNQRRAKRRQKKHNSMVEQTSLKPGLILDTAIATNTTSFDNESSRNMNSIIAEAPVEVVDSLSLVHAVYGKYAATVEKHSSISSSSSVVSKNVNKKVMNRSPSKLQRFNANSTGKEPSLGSSVPPLSMDREGERLYKPSGIKVSAHRSELTR